MAKDLFRIVRNSFWTDLLVLEKFSPEDKFFWIYVLTNPRTTQLGIYEFSISDASKHLGYTKDTVKILLDRFQNTYNVLRYSEITSEVAIKNYLRHSIVTGGKPVMDCLMKEARKVKDTSLFSYVFDNLKQYNDLNKTVLEFMDSFDLSLDERKEPKKDESGYTVEERLQHNFEILCKEYPKKVGKTEAFKRYKLWVTSGRKVAGCRKKLTNEDILAAIRKYKWSMEQNNTDLKFYKNFDTFMGDAILDYVEVKVG